MTATTFPETEPVESAPETDSRTVADLLQELGGIPAKRVRLYPYPGTATEEDLLRLSTSARLCELVAGTLVEKAMGVPEAYLGSLINWFLMNFVLPRDLGIVVQADGMYRMLHGNIREPDVSFTSGDRLPDPVPQVGGWCPDLCVEVLSPDNTSSEMAEKRREYFSAGCRLAWEVDPRKRTVMVYTHPASGVEKLDSATLDGGDVLPGFQLPLPELFALYDKRIRRRQP